MVKILSSNDKTYATDIDDFSLVTIALGFLEVVQVICDEMNAIKKEAEDNPKKRDELLHIWNNKRRAAKKIYLDYLSLKEEIEKREIIIEGATLH